MASHRGTESATEPGFARRPWLAYGVGPRVFLISRVIFGLELKSELRFWYAWAAARFSWASILLRFCLVSSELICTGLGRQSGHLLRLVVLAPKSCDSSVLLQQRLGFDGPRRLSGQTLKLLVLAPKSCDSSVLLHWRSGSVIAP